MAFKTLLHLSPLDFFPDRAATLVAGDNPCSVEFINGKPVLAFDDTDEEAALSVPFVMPTHYAGGTLKAVLHCTFESEITVTDEAVFDVAVEAFSPGEAQGTSSFDTVNSAEVDPPGTAGQTASQDVTLTNKDSVAVGDLVRVGVRRDTDAAADTCTDDCYVHGIEIQEDQ